MTERNVTHATFVLERIYKAPRSMVFAAFADFESKKQWFGNAGSAASMDFRVGGREHSHGTAEVHGATHQYRFDSIYLDIVENQRIIYAYDMDADGEHISASLTTIELVESDGGTKLKFTEQGAFLDGFDDPRVREQGTIGLLEALAKVVEK
jgi:uncharacterized protein YndB with AHSA1/START domain